MQRFIGPITKLTALCVALLVLLISFSSVPPTTAAEKNPPNVPDNIQPDKSTDNQRELTPSMRAFLQDRIPGDDPVSQSLPLAATPCTAGTAGGYPCSNVDLLSFFPTTSMGGSSSTDGNDIWGWTDPQTGTEYALMGLATGTAFVDLSDPENPVYIGSLATHTSSSIWRDIKVYANHAFIVSEANGHGMQVFDLTRLRTAVPPTTFTEDAHFPGFGSAHNIVINERSGFAYGVGTNTCSGGLHMIDISTPTSPADAGCFSSDGYTHDAQCVIYNGPDLEHIGKEVCFNSNEDTVTIVDVTTKATPIQLSRTGYTGSRYTHQAWLTEDQAILLVNDELDEQNNGHNTRTYIWDIANLDAPNLIGNYTAPTAAIDHNLYVRGSRVYQSNYRAGLRILDSSNAAAGTLTEDGFFDVYPTNNNASFNGTWSNYPYFDSDIVIISDIDGDSAAGISTSGLYVVQPNLSPDYRMDVTDVTLNICGAGNDSTTFNLDSLYGYAGSVTMSVAGVPGGASSAFSANPVSPSGTTDLTITNAGATAGDYLLTVHATDGSISFDEYLKLTIANAAAAPTLAAPANGATGVITAPALTWTAVPGATSYDIQVATDAGFTNIVDSATGIVGTSYTAGLTGNTQYFWRVRSSNFCSTSSYSAAYSFTTANISCTIYASTDVPKTISSSGTPTVNSTLTVGGGGTISDVNVLNLNGTHTWINDLDFTLTSPAATAVQIMAQSCDDENNFNLDLDDTAAPGSWPCPPTDGGTYQPSNALSGFNGEDSTGTWTLTVHDNANQDGGSLNGWSLEICTASACATPTAVADLAAAKGAGNMVQLSWTLTGADTYEIHRKANDPYFVPTGATLLQTAATSPISVLETGGVMDNYTYVIIAKNNCGAEATASGWVGEFDFSLVPGTP